MKKLGKMKDKMNGIALAQFVGLAKMYSILRRKGKGVKKAKGYNITCQLH